LRYPAHDPTVLRFWNEVHALEAEGKERSQDVLAFARAHPHSAIRALLDEPDDSGSPFLGVLQQAWRTRT